MWSGEYAGGGVVEVEGRELLMSDVTLVWESSFCRGLKLSASGFNGAGGAVGWAGSVLAVNGVGHESGMVGRWLGIGW